MREIYKKKEQLQKEITDDVKKYLENGGKIEKPKGFAEIKSRFNNFTIKPSTSTMARKSKARKLKREGFTVLEISEMMGLHDRTVYKYLRD